MTIAKFSVDFDVLEIHSSEGKGKIFDALSSMLNMGMGMAEGVLSLSVAGLLQPKVEAPSEDNVQSSE